MHTLAWGLVGVCLFNGRHLTLLASCLLVPLLLTRPQVEPGSKVVAPCRCRGTAKWMWFADMNRRRRRDPVSSRTCGTCHAVIDYAAYQKFGCVT